MAEKDETGVTTMLARAWVLGLLPQMMHEFLGLPWEYCEMVKRMLAGLSNEQIVEIHQDSMKRLKQQEM